MFVDSFVDELPLLAMNRIQECYVKSLSTMNDHQFVTEWRWINDGAFCDDLQYDGYYDDLHYDGLREL